MLWNICAQSYWNNIFHIPSTKHLNTHQKSLKSKILFSAEAISTKQLSSIIIRLQNMRQVSNANLILKHSKYSFNDVIIGSKTFIFMNALNILNTLSSDIFKWLIRVDISLVLDHICNNNHFHAFFTMCQFANSHHMRQYGTGKELLKVDFLRILVEICLILFKI